MTARLTIYRTGVALCSLLLASLAVQSTRTQQPAPRFGGAYAGLDARRQRLVDDWVARFVKTTGQQMEPGPFYDEILSLSTKTTFDAVTHALMTTQLTDRIGRGAGRRAGARRAGGCRQGRGGRRAGRSAVPDVRPPRRRRVDTLERSQQFKRGVDNSVYHKGYPTNYREQGGMPSIQISIAPGPPARGHRRRLSLVEPSRSALFNGHLTASNSDVRAGNNYDRHLNRWTGFQNWWRSFFGVRQERAPETRRRRARWRCPKTPRAGKARHRRDGQRLPAGVAGRRRRRGGDGLHLRALVCVPGAGQRRPGGLRPRHGAVSADGQPEVGARRARPAHARWTGWSSALGWPRRRCVSSRQPHHAQFVIYSVPDDVAGGVRLREPVDARRSGASRARLRQLLRRDVLRRRPPGHSGGAAVGAGGRLLEDRVVDRLVRRRSGAGSRTGAGAKVVAHQRRLRRSSRRREASSTAGSSARTTTPRSQYLSPKSYACYDLERGPRRNPRRHRPKRPAGASGLAWNAGTNRRYGAAPGRGPCGGRAFPPAIASWITPTHGPSL